MADSDSGASGKAVKKGKKKGRRTKASEKTTKDSVSIEIDDQIECSTCAEVFTDKDDELLECERCSSWYCTECLSMSAEVYKVMVERKDLHWFCASCEKQAITAVKCDKEIEEKCAAYMNSITDKLGNMEKKLDDKADKSAVDDLDARIKSLESEKAEDNSKKDTGSKSETIAQTIEEQRERELRAQNIMIQNLPESTMRM